jgi:protein-S-isoprenylcysteine O-methyltransferase Ste14
MVKRLHHCNARHHRVATALALIDRDGREAVVRARGRRLRHLEVAGVAFCAVGAIAGIFFAWIDSPFRQLSSHSVSGEWANTTNVFLLWLSHVGLYWPWSLMGACAAGLAFYGVQLARHT